MHLQQHLTALHPRTSHSPVACKAVGTPAELSATVLPSAADLQGCMAGCLRLGSRLCKAISFNTSDVDGHGTFLIGTSSISCTCLGAVN